MNRQEWNKLQVLLSRDLPATVQKQVDERQIIVFEPGAYDLTPQQLCQLEQTHHRTTLPASIENGDLSPESYVFVPRPPASIENIEIEFHPVFK